MKLKTVLIAFSFLLGLTLACADSDWKTDLDVALKEANTQGKNVLVNFTGSDWCGWCIKLDKEVFSQDAFEQFAAKELVLVKIDFPRRSEQSEALKAQNEALAEKHGIRGFPTIMLLSPEGELLGKTGYRKGGPEAYVAHIREVVGE